MPPTFVIAGKLQREYILPPSGYPLLDVQGGNLLYAAGGLAVWNSSLGMLARINEDYPPEWLHELERRNFDVRGIRMVHEPPLDLRYFVAYTEMNEKSSTNVVSHFARRHLTFPKSLLGYQPADPAKKDIHEIDPQSPAALDVPKEYRSIGHVHICPMDFTSQSQLVNLFRGGSNQTVSLDPAPNYMRPAYWRELRVVLQGVTVFHSSEEEMRALFWGETNDLWDMADKISNVGPQIIVIKRGAHGQFVYDAVQKRRYEIPAYPSRLADPTGAGDAFCGGFLAGYQKTNDPLMAALHGSISASLKIEGSGPFYPLDVLPGLAEARLNALQQLAREV